MKTASASASASASAKDTKLKKKAPLKMSGIDKITRLINEKKITPKDLDKYVALGFLNKKDVVAWRIEDQRKNEYFYGSENDVGEPVEIFLVDHMKPKNLYKKDIDNKSQIRSDLTKAGQRVLVKQLNNISHQALLQALPNDKAPQLQEFLSTDIGMSFVSMVSGLVLSQGFKQNETIQGLSKELRISSMTTVGNEVAEFLTAGLLNVVKDALKEVPQEKINSTDKADDELISALESDNRKAAHN